MPSGRKQDGHRRRSSSVQRRTRQLSVTSVDSTTSSFFNETNNHEIYSGAVSEIIPSSITSFHYPHHFGSRGTRKGLSVSRETSPLLAADNRNDIDLQSVRSNATASSAESQYGFKFFRADEIEMAPGGSTLENPEDPVDYNTDWDYSVDKYEEEQPSLFHSLQGATPGSTEYDAINQLHRTGSSSGAINDNESSYGSIHSSTASLFERRNRRGSDESDKNGSESLGESASVRLGSDVYDSSKYQPVSEYQRFYLAEEDLVIGIAGYSNCRWKLYLYYGLCILTLGLGYLVLRWLPRYRISLMGNKCPLGRADWCVIENEYGELSIVQINKRRYNERLSSFLALPKVADDESKLDETAEVNPVVQNLLSFSYRYLRFFYSPVEDIFRTNSTWYDSHWTNLKSIKEGISQSTQEQRIHNFGENNIEIEEKSIMLLLTDEVLHPFYVFQVFSVFLWLADDYFYYASCIFFISLISIVNSLIETKSTMRRLQEISKFVCEVRVWRNGFWKQVDSNDLVPGDVFEVDPSMMVVPCDALLINGECVINESMLTGESVPVSKTAATSETTQLLSEDFTSPMVAKSQLYNGTKILKIKTYNDSPVMAMVLKTGFNTTKGSLVRSMLFPKPVGFKFYEDSFKYIGFMALIAAIGFTYSTYNFIKLGLPKKLMILRALDIITIVVPPALPATLTIGTTFAISRLKKLQIFCIAPTRVNIGGKLDVLCFDKTGTLTEDGLDVLGVHVANNATGRKEIIFDDLESEIETLCKKVEYNQATKLDSDAHKSSHEEVLLGCMTSCHSLRLIEGELLGDPLDVKMFGFTRWNFTENVEDSKSAVHPGSEIHSGYLIVSEFEFVASLRRMSVITSKDDTGYVFCKGAPEVMIEICKPESIPTDYDELLHHYTHNGYRVIACAYKTVDATKKLERESAESNLTFIGFIVFENKLKPSSKPTLNKLNAAKIRTVMCTGDNILTAVSVAKECELVAPDVQHIYLPTFTEDNDTGITWENMNDPELKLDPYTLRPIEMNFRADSPVSYKLAITGDIFRYLLTEVRNNTLTQQLLMNCDVFARMSPDEKHELVEQLRRLDYTVGFCGDGANDCGALKAADVGVSLSEAEASVAAPFTSRVFEISCVLDVIREGRSSLVTSFSCFKYMSLYSAIQFITVTILYKRGTNLGDFQFLYIDLFLILPLAIFMSWSKPYEKIVVKRPTANLVSPKVLIPLCCHILVILFFQIAVWLYVQHQPWYLKPVPGGDDEVKSSDNSMLFLFTNLQYILIAIVLSTGPPYREPMSKNKPFLINVAVAIGISVALFLVDGDSWMGNLMQLTNMSRGAYWVIIGAAILNLLVMLAGEETWFVKLAQTFKRVFHRGSLGKSKKLFKNLKREFARIESV